jgi:hypothetical protein
LRQGWNNDSSILPNLARPFAIEHLGEEQYIQALTSPRKQSVTYLIDVYGYAEDSAEAMAK